MKSNYSMKRDARFMNVSRRALLKVGGISGMLMPFTAVLAGQLFQGVSVAEASMLPQSSESYFNNEGYFVHDKVDASGFDRGVIRAMIDGRWQEFLNRPYGEDFLSWNLERRKQVIDSGMQCLDGPHSAAFATYGGSRGDSRFTLNNAYKGFGLVPTPAAMDDAIDTVMTHWYDDMNDKLDILRGFYNSTQMWDQRILATLELYSSPTFVTHTFVNLMENPQATIVFLAIPGSYELRVIPRLIHPDDPDTPEMDYKRVRWTNMIHDFFHGGPYPDHPQDSYCICYVMEMFDNTPSDGARGVRKVPAL